MEKNPAMDAELLMKLLGNPEMVALLTSLVKTMKTEYRNKDDIV